jgi:hypothetical protein
MSSFCVKLKCPQLEELATFLFGLLVKIIINLFRNQ